jgi:hypothetical protein
MVGGHGPTLATRVSSNLSSFSCAQNIHRLSSCICSAQPTCQMALSIRRTVPPTSEDPLVVEPQSQKLWSDDERNRAGNEANLAFGAAYLAVNEVAQAAAGKSDLTDHQRSLLDEMARSKDQLADLFRAGAFAAVCELALSIVVLAERISMLLE